MNGKLEGSVNFEAIPHEVGVYVFLDKHGKPLYVGKAQDLKERVRSHFTFPTMKERKLSSSTRKVDWIVTKNSLEALILENNLIKEHKPRYNIQLKDDKSYPWLKVTNEPFPAFIITRTKKKDGSKYFGPYGDVGALRRTLKFIRKIFPVRTCGRDISKEKSRVCLDYHIKKCSGPCERKIGKQEYQELVEQFILFLKGENRELINALERKMRAAAERMEFKRASKLKERLHALKQTIKKQRVVLSHEATQDVVVAARKNTTAIVVVLFIRKGRLVGQTHFTLNIRMKKGVKEIVERFIKQYYSRASFIPPRIVTQTELKEISLVSSWLSQEKGRKISLRTAKEEDAQSLVAMAKKNANIFLDKKIRGTKIRKLKQEKAAKALTQLQEHLGLPDPPSVIEGYDVSSIQGAGSTGSKVSFKDGLKDLSQYRHYNLQINEPNDYAMMKELVSRRFREFEVLPDLILIDGGKGQVSAATKALQERNLNLPVIGLAKKSEQVYSQDEKVEIPENSAALLLLKRIRDEAHRFAITYHRKLRRKSDSVLDQVPGIGEKKKARLMLQFGSVEGIKAAKKEELQTVKGIGEKMADKIYAILHKR
ncbi:MAG: excinuclease ABC subunit UvrC [Candidatus Korarchaeota archaeon]|nr:excinuclease ABC subunit UvrC [Candidatus Korarchaeota archaeon]NIU82381.1 excinuclease ABC subunit UvrC [Candidatus Thorarchaeota archaeon]NIW12848.1 excinuclease ABC subunit UvrC [Candidatus Thorarchaeota archaeon]NIW51049.1 excinuclease ABC subunit UvrC [Candidatus Korarchaeota archaeon]